MLLNVTTQRVVNGIKRIRISRCRMIWLLTPLSPSPVSKLSLVIVSSVSPVALIDGRGREGVGESQIIRLRESLVLYKSFNALCHHSF